MNPLIKYGIAVAAVMAALAGVYRHGVNVTTDHFSAVINKANADNANDLAKKLADARADEQGKAKQLADIDKQNLEKAENEITSRDTTIAGLRTGAVSMRDRFTCPAASNERMPSAATSTGKRDGGEARGLQAEDGSFLVSESSRANAVVLQLQACQAVVQADRGVKP